MFDKGQADNPFKDFTIVNVVYCSGDMFVANQTRSWNGAKVKQVGAVNTEAVLAWTQANLPSVDSLVLSGSSAGSLGLQMGWASTILGRYKNKFKRAVVIADSFVGVAPPNMQPEVFRIYGLCQTPMLQDTGLSERCESGNLTIQDIFHDTVKRWPDVTFATVNSKTDMIQVLFYDLWVDLEEVGVPNIEGIRYLVNVNDYLSLYNQEPNYVSYLVNGAHHMFLPTGALYTTDPTGEASRALLIKPALHDWFTKLLGGTGGTTSPGGAEHTVESVCEGVRYEKSFWSKYLAGVLFCDRGQLPKVADTQGSSPRRLGIGAPSAANSWRPTREAIAIAIAMAMIGA